eukprot:g27741.t1
MVEKLELGSALPPMKSLTVAQLAEKLQSSKVDHQPFWPNCYAQQRSFNSAQICKFRLAKHLRDIWEKRLGRNPLCLSQHHLQVGSSLKASQNHPPRTNRRLGRARGKTKPGEHIQQVWAKKRGINNRQRGSFSSFALTLMLIHVLQARPSPLLPSLQDLAIQHELPPLFLQGADCRYCSDSELISGALLKLQGDHGTNQECVGALLLEFFRYFGWVYQCGAIAIRDTSSFASKFEKSQSFYVVDNPFEPGKDVANIEVRLFTRLREEFRRAHALLCEGQPFDTLCEEPPQPGADPLAGMISPGRNAPLTLRGTRAGKDAGQTARSFRGGLHRGGRFVWRRCHSTGALPMLLHRQLYSDLESFAGQLGNACRVGDGGAGCFLLTGLPPTLCSLHEESRVFIRNVSDPQDAISANLQHISQLAPWRILTTFLRTAAFGSTLRPSEVRLQTRLDRREAIDGGHGRGVGRSAVKRSVNRVRRFYDHFDRLQSRKEHRLDLFEMDVLLVQEEDAWPETDAEPR